MKINGEKQFGTRECPACACEVPENTNRCPICGYAFPLQPAGKRSMRVWGAILMLVLFVILILGLF